MSILCEYYNAGDDDTDSLYSPRRQVQSFLAASTHVLYSVKVKLYKSGTPTGTLTVGVYAVDASWHPTGSVLDSGTIDLASLTTDTNGAWYEVVMTGNVSLSSGTRYAIQITSSSSDTTNKGNWRCDSSSPTYTDGIWSRSDDGSTWTDSSSRDRMFEVYGPDVSGTISQINIGDAWKTIDWAGTKINIGDAWKTIVKVWMNVGDTWKTVYAAATGDFLLLETGDKVLQETNDKIKLESSS